MKYSLTITDATLDELREFLGAKNITVAPTVTLQPVRTVAPVTEQPSTGNENESDESVNVSAPAFDSSGLPWDERIHSANKGVNSNGTWRKRRGVDDLTVATVEHELKNRSVPNGGTVATIPNSVALGNVTGDNSEIVETTVFQPLTPEQFHQPQPVAPVMQPQPVAPVMQPQPQTVFDFGAFMSALAQKTSAGIIDHAYLMNLTVRTGQMIGKQLNAITDVNGNQDAINAAIYIMQTEGKW